MGDRLTRRWRQRRAESVRSVRRAAFGEKTLSSELRCIAVGDDSGTLQESVLLAGTVIGVQPWSTPQIIYFYSEKYTRIIVGGKVMVTNQYAASPEAVRAATEPADQDFQRLGGSSPSRRWSERRAGAVPDFTMKTWSAADGDVYALTAPDFDPSTVAPDFYSDGYDAPPPGVFSYVIVNGNTVGLGATAPELRGQGLMAQLLLAALGDHDHLILEDVQPEMKSLVSKMLNQHLVIDADAEVGPRAFDSGNDMVIRLATLSARFRARRAAAPEWSSTGPLVFEEPIAAQELLRDLQGQPQSPVRDQMIAALSRLEPTTLVYPGKPIPGYQALKISGAGERQSPLLSRWLDKVATKARNPDGLTKPVPPSEPTSATSYGSFIARSGNFYDLGDEDHLGWVAKHMAESVLPGGWVRVQTLSDIGFEFASDPTPAQWSAMSKVVLSAEGHREFFVENNAGSWTMDRTATVDEFRRSGKRLLQFCQDVKYSDLTSEKNTSRERQSLFSSWNQRLANEDEVPCSICGETLIGDEECPTCKASDALKKAGPTDWALVEKLMKQHWDSRVAEDWAGGLDCTGDSEALNDLLHEAGMPAEHVSSYYRDAKGILWSHDWLELDGKVLDITHSQFGDPDYLITNVGDQRYPSMGSLSDEEQAGANPGGQMPTASIRGKWCARRAATSETIEAMKDQIKQALALGPLTEDGIERMVTRGEPFGPIVQRAYRIAFKSLRDSGHIVQGDDGEWRLSSGYTKPKVVTKSDPHGMSRVIIPEGYDPMVDSEVMPEKHRQQQVDALLDQYSKTDDPQQRDILERRIREMRASMIGQWFRRRADGAPPQRSEPSAKKKIEHAIIDLLSRGDHDLTDYMVREKVILDAVGSLTPEFTVYFNEAMNDLLKSERVTWNPNEMMFKLHVQPQPVPEQVPVMAPTDIQRNIDNLLDQLAVEDDPLKKKQIEQRIRSLSASVVVRWRQRRAGDVRDIAEQRSVGAVAECEHGWPGKKPGQTGWCGRCGL